MKTFAKILLAAAVTTSAFAQNPELDDKTQRYHKILLKRPSSGPIFQRFQTAWLSNNDEKSLLTFLENNAKNGSAADIQLLANYLLQKGQDQEAIAAFTRSIEKDPNNPEALLARAQCLAKVFNFKKAITDIDQALKLTEDVELTLTANKNKGRYLLRSGQTDQAVAHWQDLAKKFSNDDELIEDVIDIQLNDGLLEPALKLATSLRDNSKDPYKKAIRTLRIGDIQKRNGQSAQAVATYLEAFDVSGSGSWLEREIIAQIEKLHRADDNITGLTTTLAKLSEKYPQRILVHQKHADLLANQGEFDKAKSIYQKLLDTNPQNLPIRVAYLQVLKKSGDHKTALKILDFLIEKNPDDLQLILQKAAICHEAEDRKALLEALNTYKTKAQPSPATSLKYATLLQKYNFPKETLTAFRQAAKDHPDATENAFAAAAYLNTHEQKPEAIELWKSIADKADRTTLIRLLDTLIINNQQKLAGEIADKQHPKFKTDPTFIQAAALVAQANKQSKKAVDYARDLILLSDKPGTLDRALTLAVEIITKADLQTDVLRDLQQKQNLNIPSTCLLIELLEFNGDIKAADKQLDTLTKSENPVALLQSARIHERRLQLEKAAVSLEKLVSLPQGGKTAFLRRLANLYERADNIPKALETINKWKTIAPNDKLAWLAETALLEQHKGPEPALLALRRGIQRFENEPEMIGRLANLYSAAGRHSEATALYWELYDAAEKLSDRVRWASMLAAESISDGSSESLVDAFNARRRKNPKAITPIMALAEIHRTLDNYEERRDLLLEATRLRPEDPTILIEIASADEQQGEIRKAMEILQKAKPLDKTGGAARRIAKLLIEEGDIDQGLTELAELEKGDPRGLESIVITLIKQQAFEEADTFLQTHLPTHPDDWRLQLLAAVIDYELGFNQKSLDKTLSILKANKPLQNITTGWATKDLRTRGMQYGFNSLPEHVTLLLLSKSAARILPAITQAADPYSSNYYGMGSGSGADQSLPKDAEAARILARLHILRLLAETSGEELTNWANKARQSGFKNLDIWQKFHEGEEDNTEFSKYVLEQLRKDSTRSDFLILQLASQLNEGDLQLPDDILTAAQKHFETNKHPAFFKALMPYYLSEKTDAAEHTKTINARVAKLDKIETPDLIGVLLNNREEFQSVMGGDSSSQEVDPNLIAALDKYTKQNPLTKKQIQGFNFRTSDPDLQLKFIATLSASNMIILGNDIPATIKELESDRLVSFASLYNMGRMNRSIQLTFPPEQLTTISNSVVPHFSAKSSALTPENLAPHIDKFTSPLLKAIALQFTGKTEEAIAALDKLTEDPALAADALLTKASILATKENSDPGTIVDLLNTARDASMDRTQRTNLDKLIVAAAMQGSTDGNPSAKNLKKDSLAHAKSAARRLMINKQVTDSSEILGMITALDMSDERDRFLTSNKNSIRSAAPVVGGIIGRTTTSRSSSSTRDQLEKKIKSAVQQKNPKRAANLIIQKLRAISSSSYSNSYEMDQVKGYISENKLQKTILKELHPGGSTSPRKWLMFYTTAKLIEDKEAASQAITFLKNLPNPPRSVRAQIALAIFETEPDRAIELLKTSRDASTVFTYITAQLNKHDEKAADYVPLMELAATYLQNLEKDVFTRDYKAAMSTEQTVDVLLSTNGWNNDKLHEYWETPVELKSQQKLYHRRDKAITTFLTLALNHIPNQTTAFQALYTRQTFRKEPLDNLIDLAKATLTAPAPKTGGYSIGGNEDETYAQAPSPAEFIVTHAYKSKDKSIISPDFIKKVKASNNGVDLGLTELNKLAFMPDAEFSKFINSSDTGNDLITTIITREQILNIRQVKDRLPNAKAILKMLSDPKALSKMESRSHYGSNDNTAKFSESVKTAALITATKSPDDLRACLQALVKSLPQDKQKDAGAWASSYFANGIFRSSEISTSSIVHLILGSISDLPATHNILIPFANEHNIPLEALSTLGRRFGGNDELIEATTVIDSLKQSNFLTSLDKFPFTPLKQVDLTKLKLDQNVKQVLSSFRSGSSNEKKTIHFGIELFTNKLEDRKSYSNDRKKAEAIIAFLKKEKSFGAALLNVLIEDDRSETIDFIKKYKSEIAKASEKQKENLVKVLGLATDSRLGADLRTHKLESLFPGISESNAKNLNNEIKKFLATKPGTVDNNAYELPEKTANFIKAVIKNDPDLAVKITLHYIKLIESLRAGSASYFSVNSGNITSMNVAQVALNDRLIPSLDDFIDIYDFTQLVYLLTKTPDAYHLNLCRSLDRFSPRDFFNEGVTPKDLDPLKNKFKQLANKIYAEKDSAKIEFHKLAWIVHFSSGNAFNGNIKTRNLNQALNQLIREDTANKAFYEHLRFATSLSKPNLYTNTSETASAERIPETAHDRKTMRKVGRDMVKFGNTLTLMNKTFLANHIAGMNTYFIGKPNPELNEFIVSVFELAAKDPDLAASSNIRSVAFHASHNQNMMTAQLEKKASLAAVQVLEHQLAKMKKGTTIHQNFILSTAFTAGHTPEGTAKLNEIVAANKTQFKGMVTIAMLLVRNGHIDTAYDILPASVLVDFQSNNDRVSFDKALEKHLPALLEKYTNPRHKLQVAYHFFIAPDPEDANRNSSTLYPARMLQLAKMLKAAKLPLTEPLAKTINIALVNSRHIALLPYLKEFLESEKYRADLAETIKENSTRYVNNDHLRFMQIQLILSEDPQKFLDLFKKVITKYHAEPKPNRPIELLLHYYMRPACAYLTLKYLEGDKESLTKLLPLTLELTRISAFGTQLPELPKHNKVSWPIGSECHHLASIIHQELGRQDEFKKFIQSLPKPNQKKLQNQQLNFQNYLNAIYIGTYLYTAQNINSAIGKASHLSMVPFINKTWNTLYMQQVSHRHPGTKGMLNTMVVENRMTPEEALSIYEHTNLKPLTPQFNIKLIADKAILNAKAGNKEECIKLLDELIPLLTKHKIYADRASHYQVLAANCYLLFGEKEKAASVFPADYDKKIKGPLLKEYKNLMRRLK